MRVKNYANRVAQELITINESEEATSSNSSTEHRNLSPQGPTQQQNITANEIRPQNNQEDRDDSATLLELGLGLVLGLAWLRCSQRGWLLLVGGGSSCSKLL